MPFVYNIEYIDFPCRYQIVAGTGRAYVKRLFCLYTDMTKLFMPPRFFPTVGDKSSRFLVCKVFFLFKIEEKGEKKKRKVVCLSIKTCHIDKILHYRGHIIFGG